MSLLPLLLLIITSISLTDGKVCENGWHRFGDKCYYVSNVGVTYVEMSDICSGMRASTVSIHSKEENDFLKSITEPHHYWIGLRRKDVGKDDFKWADGSPFNFQSWLKAETFAEPDGLNDPAASCASFIKGDWYDDHCHLKRHQLCQVNAKSKQTVENLDAFELLKSNLTQLITQFESSKTGLETELSKLRIQLNERGNKFDEKIDDVYYDITSIAKAFEDVYSSPKFVIEDDEDVQLDARRPRRALIAQVDDIAYRSCIRFNNSGENVDKCFYFERYHVPFLEANEICKSLDSSLVVINDEMENNLLKSKMLFNEDYWTAGIRLIPESPIFSWLNGNYFHYSNWAATEPKMNQTANCLSVRHGQWFASDCNQKFSFICEKVNASKSYLTTELDTTLINRHSIELNAVKSNLSSIAKRVKMQSIIESHLREVLSEVIEGKYFIASAAIDARKSNRTSEEKIRSKRSKRSIEFTHSDRLLKMEHDNANLKFWLYSLMLVNVMFFVVAFIAIFFPRKVHFKL